VNILCRVTKINPGRPSSPLRTKFNPGGQVPLWVPSSPLGAKFTTDGQVPLWVPSSPLGAKFTPGSQVYPWEPSSLLGAKFTPGSQVHPCEPSSPLWAKFTPGCQVHPWVPSLPLGGNSCCKKVASVTLTSCAGRWTRPRRRRRPFPNRSPWASAFSSTSGIRGLITEICVWDWEDDFLMPQKLVKICPFWHKMQPYFQKKTRIIGYKEKC
jgi:hypothetical protein